MITAGKLASSGDCPAGPPATPTPFDREDLAMAGHNHDRLGLFMRAVDNWLTMLPTPLVETLVADTRLSLRQVERNCKALYGKAPKALAREARALRAAAAMKADPDATYDIVEYGFYDQSHMIREIKYFTGMTPGQIRFAWPPRSSTKRRARDGGAIDYA
jgi:AraC-like DNA-binding protein